MALRVANCAAAGVLAAVLTGTPAAALEPHGAAAALDAYTLHEEERYGRIAGQIEAQEWLRFRAGLPDRRLYYGGLPGGGSLIRGYRPLWWDFDGYFEPWPVAGGWIDGYRYDDPVEQPSGHYLRPRRDGGYEYGPVYERPRPLDNSPHFAPAEPALDEPARRRPPRPPEPADMDNGPREF